MVVYKSISSLCNVYVLQQVHAYYNIAKGSENTYKIILCGHGLKKRAKGKTTLEGEYLCTYTFKIRV